MTTHIKNVSIFAAAIVATVVMALSIAPTFITSAFAKISPPSCTNNGGNEPSGQQPTCTGGGLTQNPAGNAPPGQNK